MSIGIEPVGPQGPPDSLQTESSFAEKLKAVLPKDLSTEHLEGGILNRKIKQFTELRARNKVLNFSNPVEATNTVDITSEYKSEDYIAAKQLEKILSQPEALSIEVRHAIEQLERAIGDCASKTSRRLLFQASRGERETYRSPEVAQGEQLKPFAHQLRYLICRFVRQQAKLEGLSPELDLAYLAEHTEDLKKLLEGIPQLVEDVYVTDVPLYQKVYDHFDRLRQTGEPVEIYLARDGIFAYYGRRAQAAARSAEADEVMVPKYKSLLFNRLMSGTFDDLGLEFGDFSDEQQERMIKTQERYLEQEDIRGDVHFFDTGYVGTIPEHIMQIMGFNPEEISGRIHLLSAEDRNRRSGGLRINHSGAVDVIEHQRPKLTKSAAGFVEEDGVVTVAAEPSTPKDIFYSLIIREAIHRHFWYTEKHRQD